MAVRPTPGDTPGAPAGDGDTPRAMVQLTTATGVFHARVLAARLGADGILTELRGDLGGTYPLGGEVRVFVEASSAQDARHILLADEAAAALGPQTVASGRPRGVARPRHAWVRLAWMLIALLIALYLMAALG